MSLRTPAVVRVSHMDSHRRGRDDALFSPGRSASSARQPHGPRRARDRRTARHRCAAVSSGGRRAQSPAVGPGRRPGCRCRRHDRARGCGGHGGGAGRRHGDHGDPRRVTSRDHLHQQPGRGRHRRADPDPRRRSRRRRPHRTVPRWPAISATYSASALAGVRPGAVDGGVRAAFALPLRVGAIRLGVMDLYRARPGDLDREQLADALLLADTACALLLDVWPAGRRQIRRGRARSGPARTIQRSTRPPA